jgi:hypothetical protein
MANAAIAVAACLVIGAATVTFQFVQADRARDAEHMARQATERAQEAAVMAGTVQQDQQMEADRKNQIANTVNRFLVEEVLSLSDGTVQVNGQLTLGEAIENAIERIDETLPEPTLEKASVLVALAQLRRGDSETTELLESAHEIREELLRAEHAETLDLLSLMGSE